MEKALKKLLLLKLKAQKKELLYEPDETDIDAGGMDLDFVLKVNIDLTNIIKQIKTK